LTRAIEHALAETGILIRPDGDKFAVVGREVDLGLVAPQLRDLAASLGKSLGQAGAQKSGLATTDAQQNEEILPAGSINFPQMDVNQVLQFYQELAGRTLIWTPHVGGGTISLRTCAPMSRTEAIYAVTAVFAINGISIIPAGNKFLVACPTGETNKVARLLESKSRPAPLSSEELAPGTLNLSWIALEQFMDLYQKMLGRAVEMDATLPHPTPLTLRSQTALSRAEALYGMDVLLGLNDLEVVETEGGKDLRLSYVGPARVKPR
jgi:hypothetical protein